MTAILTNIFLGCFVFGLVTTALSLLLGGGDGGPFDGGDGVHGHIGADGVSTGASGDGMSADVNGSHAASYFNLSSIMMFLTWFGATGFLLMKFSILATAVVLFLSVAAGLAGATVIFLFYQKVLYASETHMLESDYTLPGTLARITSSIRQGGAGEIVYTQGGSRKAAAARSDEGSAHPKGQEVVVVRYEKGIAYVRSVDQDFGADFTTPKL